MRSLRGMADGFEALERFLFAERMALEDAFDGMDGVTLPESGATTAGFDCDDPSADSPWR